MEFAVYSRQAVEAIKPYDVPHAIISVRTPGDPKEARLPINKHTKGVLHLVFDDIEDTKFRYIEGRLDVFFTEDMAEQVLDFALRMKDSSIKVFITHCDAGISRSSGLAAAIAKTVFDQDDSEYFGQRSRFCPNMLVYRRIYNAFEKRVLSGKKRKAKR